ncbi:uncharacterized protein LOC131232367 [Magnolia sinica]|uniref:uncharacterized protein LOC131232367 n=1 Tax=Magnolia sinica TaxID=86752 RepID=UPI0026585CE8|nr:uncharacterized protein LOC131232367 [Magnolia sinica]
MKFVYLLAGWDGSASDACVLQNALTRRPDCFLILHGKYYVVDAGYAHSPGFMAPYQGVRYHLNEFRTGRKPANNKELFNYRHAQLRNVIERSFGLLKNRSPILRTPPQFKFITQVKIVIAYCVLHNFIRVSGDDGLAEVLEDSGDNTEDVASSPIDVTSVDEGVALARVTDHARDEWSRKIDEIAERMFHEFSKEHCQGPEKERCVVITFKEGYSFKPVPKFTD